MPGEPRVLLVDDDARVLRAYGRVLRAAGFDVIAVTDGLRAAELLTGVDAVVSDIRLVGTTGLDVLRSVRAVCPDLPVVLMSGGPIESAVEAVALGAYRYLVKPVRHEALADAVRSAVSAGASARIRRRTLQAHADAESRREALTVRFDRALAGLRPHFQPIVAAATGEVYGWEALARTAPGELGTAALLDAADELDRWADVGKVMRARVAAAMDARPDATVFVNAHPLELADDDILDAAAPLSRHAARVVVELTERASLTEVVDVSTRLAALRRLGFRIAVDDLGAGHAGLCTFVDVHPDVVKLDMSLVRGLDVDPSRRAVVRSIVGLARDLGLLVVGEGVETEPEAEALRVAGCDLLQGWLFGRPAPGFPPPLRSSGRWSPAMGVGG
jgi:EAL domain-containing protein (putative c-di-GMP-specific phosphodiesterase class I)